jgi:hypothetical protein
MLVVHNPKNNITPMRVWAQVTSAQNECYLLTTTITTTMTSTATTTIAPLCGFKTSLTDTLVYFDNNGDSVCGTASYDQRFNLQSEYNVTLNTPTNTWNLDLATLNFLDLKNSWIQPNYQFFGPITHSSSCPLSTSCQAAETIVYQGVLQANYATSLCIGLANLTGLHGYTGPLINYNYSSTETGCAYAYANTLEPLCFCDRVGFENYAYNATIQCPIQHEHVTLYTFRCLPV